jgi:hypothetical protein
VFHRESAAHRIAGGQTADSGQGESLDRRKQKVDSRHQTADRCVYMQAAPHLFRVQCPVPILVRPHEQLGVMVMVTMVVMIMMMVMIMMVMIMMVMMMMVMVMRIMILMVMMMVVGEWQCLTSRNMASSSSGSVA